MVAIFEVSWGRANLCKEKSKQFAIKGKILIKKRISKKYTGFAFQLSEQNTDWRLKNQIFSSFIAEDRFIMISLFRKI